MIDWDALIRDRETVENDRNTPPSRDDPYCLGTESEIVGTLKHSNGVASVASSLQSLQSLQENKGGRLFTESETESEAIARGAATDNFCDKKYSVSPLALNLLLACCRKIEADEQEIIEAILSLRNCTPAEQVQSWALSCSNNGIDPNQLHTPALSLSEGMTCRDCLHLDVGYIQRPGLRRTFNFKCNKWHAILELGYAGERVLIAPPECSDFADVSKIKSSVAGNSRGRG
jgi:uncharacterized protein YidB (DUF937 family)